jgi:hypothetical protein
MQDASVRNGPAEDSSYQDDASRAWPAPQHAETHSARDEVAGDNGRERSAIERVAVVYIADGEPKQREAQKREESVETKVR